MGKAQLEMQSATSAISAVAEYALRFNFLFWNIAEVALRTKVFKICCALIALRFQIYFRVIAQFYTLNLILFHFDRNFNKCRPSLANNLVFFCLNSQKMRYLLCVVKFQLRKLDCALTWYKNVLPQLRNRVALQLNQNVYCGSCAALQKLKKLNCAFCTALLPVEKLLLFLALRFWYKVICAHLWLKYGNWIVWVIAWPWLLNNYSIQNWNRNLQPIFIYMCLRQQ